MTGLPGCSDPVPECPVPPTVPLPAGRPASTAAPPRRVPAPALFSGRQEWAGRRTGLLSGSGTADRDPFAAGAQALLRAPAGSPEPTNAAAADRHALSDTERWFLP